MLWMKSLFSVSWFLGFALILPISLPVGGAEIKKTEIRRRDFSDPFLTQKKHALKVSPLDVAPTLDILHTGVPLEILHSFKTQDDEIWLYVQFFHQTKNCLLCLAKRGWLHV